VYHASFEIPLPNHFTSLLGCVISGLQQKEFDILYICGLKLDY